MIKQVEKNKINLNTLNKSQLMNDAKIDYTIQMKILNLKKENEVKPDIIWHVYSL